jgi:hypothetical protein
MPSIYAAGVIVAAVFHYKARAGTDNSEGRQTVRDAKRRLAEIEGQMRKEKTEVKDELWGLIAEYMKMIRSWPTQEPILEPFILRWRPSVGETQYGRDVEAAMRWVERVQQWKQKAEGRFDGIDDLDLARALSSRGFLHQYPLGALPALLQALIRIDANL